MLTRNELLKIKECDLCAISVVTTAIDLYDENAAIKELLIEVRGKLNCAMSGRVPDKFCKSQKCNWCMELMYKLSKEEDKWTIQKP